MNKTIYSRLTKYWNELNAEYQKFSCTCGGISTEKHSCLTLNSKTNIVIIHTDVL